MHCTRFMWQQGYKVTAISTSEISHLQCMTSGVALPVFREEEEDFSSYIERLAYYFTVKEVDDF